KDEPHNARHHYRAGSRRNRSVPQLRRNADRGPVRRDRLRRGQGHQRRHRYAGVAVTQPPRQMTAVDETRPAPLAGRTELGRITVADSVVTKIAAQAAAENPDAGAAAARVLGHAVPGAGHLGVRGTDLHALPKTTVQVDGSKAYVSLEIAVRWSASVAEVTGQVRRQVRGRVRELAGLEVDEVHIVVAGLATDITPPPRVS